MHAVHAKAAHVIPALGELESDRGDYRWMFDGSTALACWKVPYTWLIEKPGAVPRPTTTHKRWWSAKARSWMTVEEIVNRGHVDDVNTNAVELQGPIVYKGGGSYALLGGDKPGARIPYEPGMFEGLYGAVSIDLTGLD